MKEIYHDLKRNISINVADYTSTQTGTSVDVMGYNEALIIIPIGAVAIADASNFFTFSLTESADNSSFTAVASTDIVVESDDWDMIINATAEANAIKAFSWKRSVAGSRYIKVVATETLTAQAIFGAYVFLSGGNKPTY